MPASGVLPVGWHVKSLGDICDIKGRIGWRGYTVEDIRNEGPLVIGPTQISTDHRLDFSKPTHLSREKFNESPEIKVDVGDILVVKVGNTIGKVAVVLRDIGDACINPNVVLLKRASVDARFLFYYLTGEHAQQFLRANSAASAQPAINQSVLKTLQVPLPPPAEQRAIAHILGTLDDKIELNRRLNETLEAMARALFKSWFVDFDPVRAKAEGRDPGLPKPIADLFPDSFSESSLGDIPAGWDLRPLGDVADVNWGDTNTTKRSYVPNGYIAYSAAGPDGFLPYFDNERVGVVVSAIGSAGLSWLAIGKWSCIKNTIRFWATAGSVSTEYLFQATLGQHKWPMRGSVQPFISQGDARALPVLIPGRGLAVVYGDIVRSFYARLEQNKGESRTLAALRDTLLPKLISGELRVRNTERVVANAV